MALAETARLVVDLAVNDQLSPALSKASAQLANLGDSARLSVGRVNDAIGNAGDQIKAKFAGISGEIQKGIGLGIGFGTAQLTAQAVSQVTEFLKGSIEAAREDELSQARLGAALKQNVAAWDQNKAAIESRVLAMTASAFSDEEVRQSLGSLVTATHDVDRAFADQSIAIDLARFKNISLAEASQQVVAIEAGRFRGLAQLGIAIKAGATAEEALAQVRAVVAGQSQAFLETDAGKAAKLKVSIDELSESFGRFASGPLADASSGLADFFDILSGQAQAGFAAQAADNINKTVEATEKFTKAELDAAIAREKLILANEQGKGLFADPGVIQNVQTVIQLLQDASDGFAAGTSDAGQFSSALDKASQSTQTATVSLGDLSSIVGSLDLGGVASAAQNTGAGLDNMLGHAQSLAAGLDTGLGTSLDTAKAKVDDLKTALDNIPTSVDSTVTVTTILQTVQGAGAGARSTDEAAGIGGEVSLPGANSLASQQRAAEDAANKRRQAADEAARKRASEAKQAAEELATANREKVANSYDAAKRASDRLFDSLHDRHIKAIKDAENLAEKQHDAALQNIEDTLAAQHAANAAPVTAAEAAQSATERARQLRDLQESVQAAQQALATNRDQSRVADLQRSLRDALEALQSFNAQDAIDKLKVAQTAQDTAAEQAAKNARDKADADLEAAKLQAAASEALVNKQDAKKKQDFDVALAALKKRDEQDPAKFLIDLKSLETKFGIFTDERGFTHIGDVVADAIKNTKPPDVHITLSVPRGAIQLNGRDINNATTVGISPTQSQSTRSGNARPRGN